jgi:flagellar biosynthetic protein FliQ
MTDGDLAVVLREAMWVMLRVGGPPLAIALVVGLLVSLLQAITQINEATLAFVPKAIALAVTMVLLGPFMLSALTEFTHLLFDRLVAAGGS